MEKKKLSQTDAPIYEALERFHKSRVVPFDYTSVIEYAPGIAIHT